MRLSWTAPTLREDGTALTTGERDALVYTMAWKAANAPDSAYVETATFPGTLNPGGQYEADVVEPAIAGPVDISMRARDADGLWSGWAIPTRWEKPVAPTRRAKRKRAVGVRFKVK